jgi:hypothetical protein
LALSWSHNIYFFCSELLQLRAFRSCFPIYRNAVLMPCQHRLSNQPLILAHQRSRCSEDTSFTTRKGLPMRNPHHTSKFFSQRNWGPLPIQKRKFPFGEAINRSHALGNQSGSSAYFLRLSSITTFTSTGPETIYTMFSSLTLCCTQRQHS